MSKMSSIVEENKNKLQRIVDTFTQDPSIDKDTKVRLVIHATSLICGIVAAQPIPFADIFVLTPIQLVMVTALNKILDNPFEQSSLKEVFTSLMAVVGWGTLAQHTILGLYKSVIPFLGGVTTIPLVYAATFALGKLAEIAIRAKKNDQNISDEELKRLYQEAKEEARKNQKKMTLQDTLAALTQLLDMAKQYPQYKNELLALEKKISSVFKEDVASSTDISEILKEKKHFIAKRLKEYKNIKVSEYMLCVFSVLNSQVFIEIAEPIIGDINYQLHKMNLQSHASFSGGSFYEVDTELGCFLLEEKNTIEIISVDLKEPYCDNPVIKYMAPSQSHIRTLQDKQIREVFHDMIKNARNNICIISPWVGKWPFQDVSALLKDAVANHNGIQIKILYGINDTSSKNRNNRADESEEYIRKYKDILGAALHTKKTNTHVKLVLCDDECYLLGSMNVLSFSAEYDGNSRLHHELAIYASDKEMVAKLKEAYFKW